MSNYSKLYWLTRLDNVHGLFIFFLIIGILSIVVMGLYRGVQYMESDDIDKKPWRWFTAFTFLTIGVLGITFTPTKEEAIFIAAGGKVMDFVQTDSSINKIPGQTTAILSTWMDKELKKLKNDVDSTKNNK